MMLGVYAAVVVMLPPGVNGEVDFAPGISEDVGA